MTCEVFHHKGATVFVCSRGKRGKTCSVAGCRRKATKLCDYKLRGAKAGSTCDRALCDAHAVERAASADGDTIDFCPPHAELGHG